MSTELAEDRESLLYAGLGRRLGAYLLDFALSTSILIVVGVIVRILGVAGLWHPTGPGGQRDPVGIWRALGGAARFSIIFGYLLCLGPIYFALFESSPWQATFGKRLLQIHVTRDDRSRIGILRSLSRWLAKFISIWFGLSLISIITITATKTEKALHDYVASTVVLRGRPDSSSLLGSWRAVLGLGIPFVWTLLAFLWTMSGPSSP